MFYWIWKLNAVKCPKSSKNFNRNLFSWTRVQVFFNKFDKNFDGNIFKTTDFFIYNLTEGHVRTLYVFKKLVLYELFFVEFVYVH